MRTRCILLVFPLILIEACGGLNKNELREYVEDRSNGLVQEIDYPSAKYHMMFRPNDLAYVYQLHQDKPDKSKLEIFKKDRENTSLFILDITLSKDIKNKVTDYTQIRETYQDALNADLSTLIDGEETVPCLIYHCETQGQGNYRINLMFGKGISNIKNNWKVQFYDPVTGDHPEFNFSKEDLLKIPSLKI